MPLPVRLTVLSASPPSLLTVKVTVAALFVPIEVGLNVTGRVAVSAGPIGKLPSPAASGPRE